MKKFVNVIASFDTDGSIRPLKIIWDSEMTYDIDRVSDIRYASSLKGGGAGIRYTCHIRGHCRYLFFENGAWFVEDKNK